MKSYIYTIFFFFITTPCPFIYADSQPEQITETAEEKTRVQNILEGNTINSILNQPEETDSGQALPEQTEQTEQTETIIQTSPNNNSFSTESSITEEPVWHTDSVDSAPTLIQTKIEPKPLQPFKPSANTQKTVVPEYILYLAQSPDFQITSPNPFTYDAPWLLVGARSQTMKYYDSWGRLVKTYPISTAKKGVGEIEHSYKTPRGHHKICERIGDNLAPRTIISRRQATPWLYSEELHQQYPKKDWILTRIMWLCGQEEGKNKGYNQNGQVVDSYRRYIYIHGAGDHAPFGRAPSSLGCVRMNSEDVIELYDRTQIGTDVLIEEFQ